MALNSAGICATRPSPMVRIEKTCIASPASIPCEKTPTARPPTRLISTMTMEAMASPFTNFIAPSRLPCSLLSSSSVRRRSRASSLPISPDRRSLSIDNCLPGIASRLNRAATSATRSAPLEMTMNCTTVMIRKTTSPTIRLPPATISPNCWMMCPPSAVVRIMRVVAIDSDRRNSVESSSTVGKVEKSSDLVMCSVESSSSRPMAILVATSMSIMIVGSGRISSATIATTATISIRSAGRTAPRGRRESRLAAISAPLRRAARHSAPSP